MPPTGLEPVTHRLRVYCFVLKVLNQYTTIPMVNQGDFLIIYIAYHKYSWLTQRYGSYFRRIQPLKEFIEKDN